MRDATTLHQMTRTEGHNWSDMYFYHARAICSNVHGSLELAHEILSTTIAMLSLIPMDLLAMDQGMGVPLHGVQGVDGNAHGEQHGKWELAQKSHVLR